MSKYRGHASAEDFGSWFIGVSTNDDAVRCIWAVASNIIMHEQAKRDAIDEAFNDNPSWEIKSMALTITPKKTTTTTPKAEPKGVSWDDFDSML